MKIQYLLFNVPTFIFFFLENLIFWTLCLTIFQETIYTSAILILYQIEINKVCLNNMKKNVYYITLLLFS